MQSITINILVSLLTLASLVLTYFVEKAIRYLTKKLKIELNQKTEDEIINTVSIIVGQLNQTVVSDIKEKNGKLSIEDAEDIFKDAKHIITGILTGAQTDYMTTKYGDVDTALEYIIEYCVGEAKTSYLTPIESLQETTVTNESTTQSSDTITEDITDESK